MLTALLFSVLWQVAPCGDFERPEAPEELSGITWAGGDRYLAVNDKDLTLHELTVCLDRETGEVTNLTVGARVTLAGPNRKFRDAEGLALDPLDPSVVWVSEEATHAIRAFDRKTGRCVASAPVPKSQSAARPNRSLESLTIAPDGRTMWTANEEALPADGPVSNAATGTVVRLVKFVRSGAGKPWRAAGEWRYRTDPWGGAPWHGKACSGVSDLVAPDGASLIVLEREMSQKGAFPTCRMRLYAADVSGAPGGARPVAKRLLHDEDTVFANYEGMCLGPVLNDGSRALVAVSDGGGPAVETVATYRLSKK